MFYVYLLQDPGSGRIYIGYTSNLKQRCHQHQRSEHPGWALKYYEAYASEDDARKREQKLKHHGSGVKELKKRLEKSLANESQSGAGPQ